MTNNIFFTHYGGNCPNCNSTNTAFWTREIHIPDGLNEFQDWQSCHDCRHTWQDDVNEASTTYLLNNGYTQESLDKMIKDMKERIGKLLDKHRKDDSEDES